MAMKLEYVKVTGYTKDTTCPHNDGCKCATKSCYKCGWNPTVAKMRLDKFRGKKTEG